MQLPVLDLAIFFVYMAGIVIFGATFYFKNKNPEQYTSGGGKLPSWVVGMSFFATYVSSISFLALPGNAYQSNWNAFVFSLSIPIAAILAIKFFVPLYRSLNSISAYNYLEVRFGAWARVYASLCYILTQLMRTGSILYLLALPLNAMLGWSISSIIIVTGISIIVYSMLGGIQAVIWTDAIQGIVLIIGAVICLITIIVGIPGGVSTIVDIGLAENKFSLGTFDMGFTEATFWVMLVYGLFINLQNYGIDQNYVQRYMTTKSLRGAKNSTLFGALLYVPVSLVFFMIGTALYVYFKVNPGVLPAELASIEMADKVFPYFIVNNLPAGVTGLLVAAIFAAGMSTVSTSVNGTATIILTDYYNRYFLKEGKKNSSMKVLYLSSFIFGVLGIIIGIAMTGVKSALDAWWMLASIFSGGMLGLFLLGFLVKKADKIAAAIGTVVGVLVIFWLSISPIWFNKGGLIKLRSPFHANLTIVIGTTVIFLVGFLITWFFNRNKVKS